MWIADSEASLRAFLSARGLALDAAEVEPVLSAMLDWYREERAADAASLEEDGDMLLFQWGTDQRDGAFEYGLTRQLIEASDAEDEGIYQVSVTFRFRPDARTSALGSGSSWCASPDELRRFQQDIAGQPASAYARESVATDVRVLFEVAG